MSDNEDIVTICFVCYVLQAARELHHKFCRLYIVDLFTGTKLLPFW